MLNTIVLMIVSDIPCDDSTNTRRYNMEKQVMSSVTRYLDSFSSLQSLRKNIMKCLLNFKVQFLEQHTIEVEIWNLEKP